jgi:localization factor PodJL
MKSKRVSDRGPDRVHVVRTPEQDRGIRRNSEGQSSEIVKMLAHISDKLKRSEAERYELLGELRSYRKILGQLEDKAENSEKAYLALESKLSSTGESSEKVGKRQIAFENKLKQTEEKMVKAIAGQALIDERLKETADKQTAIDARLDRSVFEQTKLGRQIEMVSQDKSVLLRKLERLENMMGDGNILPPPKGTPSDKYSAKLISDDNHVKTAALSAPQIKKQASKAAKSVKTSNDNPWWSDLMTQRSVMITSAILLAILAGWGINQMQRPELPAFSAAQDTAEEVVEIQNENTLLNKVSSEQGGRDPVQTISTTPANMSAGALADVPENVLDYNDEQLLAALNDNPKKLAGKLNEIEPSAADAKTTSVKGDETAVISLNDPQITQPMRNFEQLAFKQDAQIAKTIQAEYAKTPLASRTKADSALPAAVKNIEKQAFQGDAEAQHDLAAIYTAGHGGVEQNFDRAAFWFREASENGIGNARYNLGVLYHQGLGQERDLGRALYWYREAAKLGHAEAQYNLGIAHIEGIGTDYNPRLASAFFERAANNGITEAAYNLGLIYENGLLGEENPQEALMWYKISADQGSADAKSALEQLVKMLQIDMKDVDKFVERMQQINESVKGRRAGPVSEGSAKTSSVEARRQMITQVQEYLIMTGAYKGPADGILGANTEKAINDYQKTNGLAVDGRVSNTLLEHMVDGAVKKLSQR